MLNVLLDMVTLVLVRWSRLFRSQCSIGLLVYYDIRCLSPDRFIMFQFSKGYFRERWISDLLPDVTVRAIFLLEVLFRYGLLYLPPFFSPENTLKHLLPIGPNGQTHIDY